VLLKVIVRIFGAPTACATGTTDAWRDTAMMIGRQLVGRFGNQVIIEYFDLFGPEMDRFPNVLAQVSRDGLTLPLVYVNDELFSSGGKINGPAIRQRIEALTQAPKPWAM
jgi:disulfide oxidoreductase YuzD